MRWLLTRGRFPFLALLAAVVAFFGFHAARVGIEKDNQSLNTRNPEQLAAYERFRQLFGSDEDLLLAVHDPALLEPEGLLRLDEITTHVGTLAGVRRVFSLTNAKQLVSGDIGAVEAPLIPRPLDAPSVREQAHASLQRNPDFTGWLISGDRRTAGIILEIEDRPGDDEYRSRLIAELRSLMNERTRDGVTMHLTGIAVQKHDVAVYVDRDRRILMPVAVVLLGTMLALFFRNVLGVVLPLAVTGISVGITLGIYGLAGLQLNAITALLPPVIMVLSVAVSMHLVQAWLRTPASLSPLERTMAAVRRMGFPCFFCSITTALGLGSLLVAELPAVRQFGLFAAIGVLLSFVVGITLVPVGLTFLPAQAQHVEVPQHPLLRRFLQWTAEITAQRTRLVLSVFAIITVVSLLGLPLMRVNTDLVRFLQEDAPLHRDTLFIDEHLTGASILDFMIRRRDGQPMNSLQDVARLERFEAAAKAKEPVTGTTSVLAALRQLHRAENRSEGLTLPQDERDTRYLFDLLEAAEDRSLLDKLITRDLRHVRVSVRMHAVGTAVSAPLADEITEEGRAIFGEQYELTPTGAFYTISQDSNRLVLDLVRSFVTGCAAVFVAIALLFGSLELTLISLAPNIMPLFWTGGMMGFFGIDLSTGTAMIASAVIGLVVDDTIHYLAEYRDEYRGDAVEAVRRTTTGIGSALVVNNLFLVFGFWVGCFGSFKPTVYFSLLTGLTMITAMLCDVFVTPASLIATDRRKRR
ncbi:MAG TPA: MMPL family transporter [Candidatus Limnocylindrales bacterium]|nr:MMPL family transporter [Candidatus Limnocylindrales bacterium]